MTNTNRDHHLTFTGHQPEAFPDRRMGPRSPVLFLDFDGVLHPMPHHHVNVFCQLPILEEVLLTFPEVRIVVSSSWRESYDLAMLREVFSPALQPQVIDVTPRWDVYRELHGLTTYSRQWECEKWLAQNGAVGAPWLAIDDMREWFEPDCPDLLWTNPKTGFTEDDVADLRARLTLLALKED